MDRVLVRLKPGDVLTIPAGTHEGWNIAGLRGTAAAPIRIRGEPGAVVRPRGERDGIVFWGGGGSEHVIIEGLTVSGARRGGIVVGGSRHITIRHCTLSGNAAWGVQTSMSHAVTVEDCELYGATREHGIYFSTTDSPVARRCHIHDNVGCGIHMNGDRGEGGDGMISDGLIEENVIYANGQRGGAGINMDGVERTVVRANLLADNRAGGIVSFNGDGARPGDANRFERNVVLFAAGQGRYALKLTGGQNLTATNNLLVCGRGPALEMASAALKGLRADANRYLQLNSVKPISLDEIPLDLPEWRRRSGQDTRSAPLSASPALDRAAMRREPSAVREKLLAAAAP
jgi:parallel beta-helix repeat protein